MDRKNFSLPPADSCICSKPAPWPQPARAGRRGEMPENSLQSQPSPGGSVQIGKLDTVGNPGWPRARSQERSVSSSFDIMSMKL